MSLNSEINENSVSHVEASYQGDRQKQISLNLTELENSYDSEEKNPENALFRIGRLVELNAAENPDIAELFDILGEDDPSLGQALKRHLLQSRQNDNKLTGGFLLGAGQALK